MSARAPEGRGHARSGLAGRRAPARRAAPVVAAAVAVGLAAAAAGCAPRQVIEVHTAPPGAAVFVVTADGARRAVGAAPVRFIERSESDLQVVAEHAGYEPAAETVPGRDVQAFIDLVLAPVGDARDEALALEMLLVWGPLGAGEVAARAPALAPGAAARALAALLTRGEVRALPGAAAADPAAAGPAYDIEVAGLERLAARLPQSALLERLRVSRLALYQRARRAEDLLEAARDRR